MDEKFASDLHPSDAEKSNCTRYGCNGFARFLFIVFGCLGILSSLYGVISCDFFTLDSPPTSTSFPDSISRIGLFSYSTLPLQQDSSSLLEFSASCTPYDNQFMASDFSGFFQAAQFAAVIAPCLAAIAILIHAMEWLNCRFFGSFISPIILYLLACLVQGYTFVIYGETDFWYVFTSLWCMLPRYSCSLTIIVQFWRERI